uniref:Uncharacterized protein n=1 Tax=Meloidogyne enterolobii TaxID=390850 RepID=A0A6V7XTP3_MELEN|nr:unnamed protein product [Meloidogyne enterolobii]
MRGIKRINRYLFILSGDLQGHRILRNNDGLIEIWDKILDISGPLKTYENFGIFVSLEF